MQDYINIVGEDLKKIFHPMNLIIESQNNDKMESEEDANKMSDNDQS